MPVPSGLLSSTTRTLRSNGSENKAETSFGRFSASLYVGKTIVMRINVCSIVPSSIAQRLCIDHTQKEFHLFESRGGQVVWMHSRDPSWDRNNRATAPAWIEFVLGMEAN